MKHLPLAAATALSVFSLPALADDTPLFVGEPVIVTASRFADPAPAGVGMTIIDAADIRRSPAVTLPELIASRAGVNLSDLFGNHAAASTLDMRGFGASGGQNTLILIDGRRATDIDRTTVQWSALPLSAIERVEILHGEGAVLYGGGTSGGVINIVTRTPRADGSRADVGARAGSWGTRELFAGGEYRNGAFGMHLGGNRYLSDGYRENNRNEQSNGRADLRWRLDGGEIALKLAADRQHLRLPGARQVQPSAGVDQLSDDRRAAATPLDWSSRDGNQASVELNRRLGTLEVSAELAWRDKHQQAYFDFGGFPDFRDTRLDVLAFTPRLRGQFGTHQVTAGADLYRWDYRLKTSNSPANIGQPINRVSATQDNLALYLQDRWQIDPATRLGLGGRVERQRMTASDIHDATAPGGLFGSAAPAGGQTLTRNALEVSLQRRIDPTVALYGKIGRSYRLANVDEIYETDAAFSREFQFLRPQTANQLEIGGEYTANGQRARVALFVMDVRDEIHLDPYTTGAGNTNLPPSRRHGLEMEGRWQPAATLTLDGSYTWTVARFREGVLPGAGFTRLNVDIAGKNVPLVPRHQINAGAHWQIDPKNRLSALARGASSQYMDNDEPNDLGVKIPAYAIADLQYAHRAGALRLTASVNNVFDRKYHTYAVRSQFVADRYNAYPLPERSVSVALEYAFR